MIRVSRAFCLFLFCGVSVMAQDAKLDVAVPQPAAVAIGNGTDAQQAMRILGGKGGNSTDPNGHPGAGSGVLIKAGDGGDGPVGVGINGAGKADYKGESLTIARDVWFG